MRPPAGSVLRPFAADRPVRQECRDSPILRELPILASARVRRQQLADTWVQPARRVRCEGRRFDAEAGRWARCPGHAESGRFGRTRRYHSPQCQRSAKWLRAKARRSALPGRHDPFRQARIRVCAWSTHAEITEAR
jgi:hypothetical protein